MTKSKHIVITGAGSGLGASLAYKYNELGHHVTLIGRTEEKLATSQKRFSIQHILFIHWMSHLLLMYKLCLQNYQRMWVQLIF